MMFLRMSTQKKMQKELVKIRKVKEEIMSKEREVRHRCEACNMIIIWDLRNRCDEYERSKRSNNVSRVNQEIMNEGKVERKENEARDVRTRIRQRCGDISERRS